MSEQRQPLAAMPIFALPATTLATLRTQPTIAAHYPLLDTQGERSAQRVVYFDTADYRLLRTGFAVCVTQENEQTFLTIENLAVGLTGKRAKAISRRKPVTAVIASSEIAATVKAWPKALRKAVAPVLSHHAKLRPLLLVERKRTVRTIAAAPSAGKAASAPPPPLATLNLENVTVWLPAAGVDQQSAPAPECAVTELGQVTVEFATSTAPEETVNHQEVITTWLASQPGLLPVASSHQPVLEQALLAASHCTPGLGDVIGLQPQMLVADGCRLLWQEQLMVMLLNEAGIRYSQDREYVHEMRVAIRRVRAAAQLYGHFLPRKIIRPYLATLRKTGRLLGHIRNLDVVLTKARRMRTQTGQAPKKLLKAWRQQRHTAQQKLIHWLDSSEYSDFLVEFQHFCLTPEAHSKHHAISTVTPIPQQIRHVIPTQILEGYAAVRCYEALFEAGAPVDDETLHQLRIACKYLRYNLEFVQHLLGPECAMLITRLKALQELLGELNDAVVAQQLVDEANHGGGVEAYQQAQATLVAELSQRVPIALATLIDQDSRTQLAQALARL